MLMLSPPFATVTAATERDAAGCPAARLVGGDLLPVTLPNGTAQELPYADANRCQPE